MNPITMMLLRYRQSLNLDQRGMAKLIGLTAATYNRIERTGAMSRQNMVKLIAFIFGGKDG